MTSELSARGPASFTQSPAFAFQAAILDAYDQALICSEEIIRAGLRFTDAKGDEIALPKSTHKIQPICVIAEHYPALSAQAHQFLKTTTTDKIAEPLVCDVFALDTITELLETPLRLLSYLELRSIAGNNVFSSHENVVLGFHLKRNLWLKDYDAIQLGDDIAIDIDIAMMARRDGIQGEKVPPGILTYHRGLAVGRIIEELEKKSEPWAVETGLALLTIGGDTVRNISEAIDLLVADAKDGRQHDFTTGSAVGGITVHCSSDDMIEAASRLKRHCELKKYSQKAPKWYGLALSPGDGRLRFTVVLDHPWQHDLNLDQESRKLPNARSWQDFRKFRKRLAATKK